MTTLWDTSGRAVVAALAAERRAGGAITSGSALTLVCAVDEHLVPQAEQAATVAASNHPMRRLLVVRHPEARQSRLDAEVLVGAAAGPGDLVVLRLHGEVAEHADSVVVPLLAPDVPVVTWWHGSPPEQLGEDPLTAAAQRRVTDVTLAPDPALALAQRAQDFAPGDTDLAWTRITPWRTALASAYDAIDDQPRAASIIGHPADPSAQLLAGWLSDRFRLPVPVRPAGQATHAAEPAGRVSAVSIRQVSFDLTNDDTVSVRHEANRLVFTRTALPTVAAPFHDRDLGELLTEELRRLDNDEVYARALETACGEHGLAARPARRCPADCTKHAAHSPITTAAAQTAVAAPSRPQYSTEGKGSR